MRRVVAPAIRARARNIGQPGCRRAAGRLGSRRESAGPDRSDAINRPHRCLLHALRKILFSSGSGYDIALHFDGLVEKFNTKKQTVFVGKLLWLLPELAAGMLYLAYQGKSVRGAAKAAGVFPLIVLAYLLIKFDFKVGALFDVMTIGAYAMFVLGAFLVYHGFRRVEHADPLA